ncbi:transmembrane protein 168-like [Gigantopelta aegis]|uniref:transmembrane protein 168-like n=1 Tax=Gigantopelta aegis TaxID=1735272 RepID=UPI001B88CDE5|nr:transmembrane protein 168-like [Gigantopelta aegis]
MYKFKDLTTKNMVQYIFYVPDVILMVAIGLGMYTQWMLPGERQYAISVIALMGILVIALSCALRYFFSLHQVGKALYHIWIGCLVGIIAFLNSSDIEFVTTQEVMEALFMASLVLGCFSNILQRFLHLQQLEGHIFAQPVILESVGIVIAGFVTTNATAIWLLTSAFVINTLAMRMKSFLGFCSFIAFVFIGSYVFFPDLKILPNKYALMCFIGRHAFQPIIDFHFSGLTVIERWKPFLAQSRLVRYLTIIFVFGLNISLCVLIGVQSASHKEWFVVVPLFIALAIVWMVFHMTFFISCWKLMGKITECNLMQQSLLDESQSYNRIMAAKGIRHSSLISQRVVCLSLTMTVVMMGIGWETRSPYSLSLILMVLPIEAMTLSLFWKLCNFLGGTCTGYAVIAPVTTIGPNGGAKLLNATTFQDITARATTVLSQMNNFFNFHMIDNYGCDYSTSGLGTDYVENKVKAFFDRRTTDGPRFDTYILYYSGDVYETGDWALTDNKCLTIKTLLDWWTVKNGGTGARLILVLDSSSSFKWTRSIRKHENDFVAIQTCHYKKTPDPEFGNKNSVGSFTDDWVRYNLGVDINPPWTSKDRTVSALYAVSKCWTDFRFHLPSNDDIADYWDSSFPRLVKPLIKVVNLPSIGMLFCCCDSVMRCLRRKQMSWIPPKEIDTGHGFKLVRS